MSDTTDYEIDIRSIDTDYTTTLPRDVNEHIDPETTVSPRSIVVTVKVEWDSNRDRRSETFEIGFRVDHADGIVEAKAVGDAFSEVDSMGVGRVLVALDAAERAVWALLEEIGLDYHLRQTTDRAHGAQAPAVDVHNAEGEIGSDTAAEEEVPADD